MDCIFFVNPSSGPGQGRRLAEEIEQYVLPAAVFKQVVFTDPRRLHQQVYSCAKEKDLVVICGGDGTVSSIIAHLVNMDKVPALAIIPLGTGNDVARSTGWLKSWNELGLDGLFYAIKKGKVTSLDVWQMNIKKGDLAISYPFCAYVGMGYDGRVCQEFSKLNRFFIKRSVPTVMKRLLYLPAGMRILYKNLLYPEQIRCTVSYEGPKGERASCDTRVGQLLFCNTGFYAGGSLICKHYSLEDGLLEFFGIKGYLSYMQLLFEGRLPVGKSSILPIRASGFEITFCSSAYFQVDGEPAGVIEGGSQVNIDLLRSLPFLKPLKDRRARKRLKDASLEGIVEKISSSARPAVT